MNPNTMDPEKLPQSSKPKRKPSTAKRVRHPKPQAILDIEKQAADLKAKYRAAQSSGGLLNRIQMLILRLTPEHRQALYAELNKKALYDELGKTETPNNPRIPNAMQCKSEPPITA